MTSADLWTHRGTWSGTDLKGFEVEAVDGDIGKVDEASDDVGGSYLVINTGPWIFGKKVMLPAGVIREVDFDSQKIFVNRTKESIKNAPEFNEDRYTDPMYREELGRYYGADPSFRDDLT